MGRALIEPNYENASLDELAVAMKCSPHQPGALRIRSIWAIGQGIARPDVALFCNVDEKTILEWVKRFNAEGIDRLAERPRCISKEEMRANSGSVTLRADRRSFAVTELFEVAEAENSDTGRFQGVLSPTWKYANFGLGKELTSPTIPRLDASCRKR